MFIIDNIFLSSLENLFYSSIVFLSLMFNCNFVLLNLKMYGMSLKQDCENSQHRSQEHNHVG